MRAKCAALGILLASLLPSVVAAQGAWTTFLRPYSYTDLLAVDDTVWCATLEAGLLRFTPSSGTYQTHVREPGGLSSNRISVLELDRSNRLWVGTVDAGIALLQADRQSWGVVNAFDGLPSDTVTALAAVNDTMWIGTPRGLALWNGLEIAGTLPDLTTPSPFDSDFMSGLVPLGDTLWIGTHAGVYRGLIPTGLDPIAPINTGLIDPVVTALVSDGFSVFALSDSVYRFDRPTAMWVVEGGIGEVLRLSADHGVVWASSRLGAYRWNGTGWTFEANLTSSDEPTLCPPTEDLCGIFALTSDAQGKFYGADRRGVRQRPGGVPPLVLFEPPSPPGNTVQNLLLQGTKVYVGTAVEGFGRFDGNAWRLWPPGRRNSDTTFVSPVFNFAMAIDDSGRKWVACWEQALERFDDSVSPPAFEHIWTVPRPQDPHDPIASRTHGWGAAVDSNGGVWFGNHSPREDELPDAGLDFYDNQDRFANFSPTETGLTGGRIHALTVDRNGTVWLGYAGRGGVARFTPPDSAAGTIDPVDQIETTENDDVRGIAAFNESVWVLTTSELRRYLLTANRDPEERFTVPASPADRALNPLAIAPDGTAWLGTVNGVRAYRPDGSSEDFNSLNSPLPNDEVRVIRIDPVSGVVWFGTAEGMSRFDPGFVPVVPEVPRLDVRVFPSPARLNQVSLGLRLSGNSAGYEGRIHDLGGRLVNRFQISTNGQVIWNGRDLEGRLVEPGIYFVRVQAGGRIGFARVVVLR